MNKINVLLAAGFNSHLTKYNIYAFNRQLKASTVIKKIPKKNLQSSLLDRRYVGTINSLSTDTRRTQNVQKSNSILN